MFLIPLAAWAVPVAVNDSYSTPEDTPVGSAAVELVNATFDNTGGGAAFDLPNNWQMIDLKTTAAGGAGAYPADAQLRSWKAAGFDSTTSTVTGWRSGTLPVQAGGISHANFSAVPVTLTGVVPGGPNTVNTYLFRNQFTLTAAQAAHPSWAFSVLADDGAVIYVNGQEAGRVNYPAEQALTPDSLNGGQAGDENNYTTLALDLTGVLVTGTNVISIELHQNSAESSDAGLDFGMAAVTAVPVGGFTEVVDAFFGTDNAFFSTRTWSSSGGFNASGGLRLQMGNVFSFGGNSQAVSGAWSKTFTMANPATVSLSFRHRLISGQDYDAGEFQELICDVDGTQYGTVTAPGTHLAVNFQTGNGNGGGAIDSGWKQSSFTIPLAAGTHTLSLGGFGNAGSPGGAGTAQESFEAFFDEVLVTVPGRATLLANDTGGVAPVTAVKVTNPAHGTVTVSSNGNFLYTPEANFFGTDSFTYRAVDGTGQSPPAVVTLNVASVNDAPVAREDGPYTTLQDTALTVNTAAGVLANDTDTENSPLTAVVDKLPEGGNLLLNGNGSFTFTPAGKFSGTTTFTYHATDGSASSAPVTVAVQVTDAPDAPVALADTYTAVKNTALAVTATVPGTTTEELLPFQSADWHYYDSLVPANRDLGTLWRTGAYTETADWKTGPAELGYGDGDEATQIADNPDPLFVSGAGDKFATAYFRRTLEIPSLVGVTGVEVTVLFDDACVFFLNGVEGGRSSDLPDALSIPDLPWDYFPSTSTGDNTTQTFILPASALQSGTNLIAAEVHQNAASSTDLSFDLRLRVIRAASAGVLANDSDPDPGQTATLTAEIAASPAHGTLAFNANGTFTYTPANNYTGPDSFTYRTKDSTGRFSATVTAGITVIDGPNVSPIARPDTYAAVEDTLLTVNAAAGLLANDSDAEGDAFTAILATPPAHGILTLNPNGAFTYQPAASFNGADSFTYQARDNRSSPPATVTLNVSAVNDLPFAANDSYAGDPGVPFVVTPAQGVLANDSDADTGAVLTAQLVTPPSGATLTLNPDGSFSLTAAIGGVYTFTYRAKDETSQSAIAAVTVALNAAPTARADAYSTDEDVPLNVAAAQGVLTNDSDPENQPLQAQFVSGPQHGTLILYTNGGFLYTPSADYSGADGFTYRVSDGTRQSAAVAVALTVKAVNDPPAALADTYGVRVDTALQVNAANGVLRNDSDAEKAILSATLVTPPADGALVLNSDGSFTYTPAAGFSGARTFTYRAGDGAALSAVTTVTLNVSSFLNTVAISEIMYNPPGVNGVREEFVEIYNYGDAAVDLTGWEFTKGVNYLFPSGVLLTGRAYLVIPADRTAFSAKYPAVANVLPAGWGAGSSLGNGSELIRLLNSNGDVADEVEYADEGDWAVRKLVNVWDSTNTPGQVPPSLDTDPGLEWVTDADPDPENGIIGGASLQLRNAALSNDSGLNWAASAPTPGAANTTVAQTNSPPLISGVLHSPAVPDHTRQVFVTAAIQDELRTGITASVFYRTWLTSGITPATAFTEVTMADNGLRGDGAAGDGVFGAVLPAQALATVVEFYVRAADAGANARTWPAPTLDLDGANPAQNANCLYQVDEEVWTDHRPLYQMIMTGADNVFWNAGLGSRSSNVAPNTTVILRTGNQSDVRYQAGVRARGNSSRSDTPINLRLDLPKDRPWNGRTAFTLNYKFSYSQFLASRLFESAGVPVEKAGLVSARINGVNRILDQNGNRTFGFYCDLMPRGGDTIKEWFPGNDDGNGYGKIRGNTRWGVSTLPVIGPAGYPAGGYVNEGYNKQTNAAQNDWTDLDALIRSLNAGNAATFHNDIAGTVDIDEWCRFLALCTIVNHAETNMSNGDDDDYSLYFGATDKLARLIPHDLDTCFNLNAIGLGDESAPPAISIYQCTEPNYPTDSVVLPQMEKFYRNPVLGRKFKAALRYYLDHEFAKPAFDATVDQLLDSQWMGTQFTPDGDTIRTHIKAFLDTRRATIETFLPAAFTAATALTVQNGFPRSASATDLGGLGGKIDPARTALVTVNGIAVTTNPYGSTAAADNTWSAGGAITLLPGLNTLLCEARDEAGLVFASQTVSIWYDAPGVSRSGTLTASEIWSAASGPYNLTGNFTVPSGLSLTLQAGTTVYLAAGANLTVSTGGTLNAAGTPGAGITLARIPSGSGDWGGVTVNGGTARLSYVTFANNGDTALHARNGAEVTLDHLAFRNTNEPYLELDGSSFHVSDCVFPANTSSFELVHGTGGIAAGGRGIIRNCRFGKTSGYNDSLDFTGGNRPGPALQVLNCVFEGSDDDQVDIDSTDAWIEGNIFLHCHRSAASPDSASGVSGGADNADFSQVTVINNLFYDCDNAVTMKQGNSQPNGNSAVLLNNTIVRITKAGGIDSGSGVVNFDDVDATGEGKGMYLEGNIISDIENLARNFDPALSRLVLNNNLLPAAPPAGATASGNIIAGDAMLNTALITSPATATAEQVLAALTPQLCSPAIGRGPLGRTLGADLSRLGITVQAVPGSVRPASVTLVVGPGGSFTPLGQTAWTYGFTHYRYRLDNGALSAEIPVATPLALTNLAPGSHTLRVEGRNDAATWQDTPVEISFNVVAGAPAVVLSEVLADSSTGQDWLEFHNWGATPANVSGCLVSDDPAVPGKFIFPAGTTAIPPGGYLVLDANQLGFSFNKGGETLSFSTASGELLDSVVFGPQITDFSIARSGGVWRLATPSPAGAAVAACVPGSGGNLRINEWLGSNNIVVSGDFVELYNPDPLPVELGGYSMSQDFRNEPEQSPFPPNSYIAGGGFLALNADGDPEAGGDHLNFKINRIRDVITLLDPAGNLVDNVMVLPGNPDVSQGRTPDGAVTTTYLALPTPGFSNGSNLTADTTVMNGLRITEIMFDPPNNGAEYIEFRNVSAAPLTLTGVTFDSGLTFTFPATTLAAGGYLVITQNLPAFTAQYPGVPAVQWASGRLDNSGESLRITTGGYGLGILDFRYEGTWYPETRTGASLEIVNSAAGRGTWGDAVSWQPAPPSPGGPSPFGVLAPADTVVTMPESAILNARVAPGAYSPSGITVAWKKVSGPGAVSFTAPSNKVTDATFSLPGLYELSLTATPPGGGAAAVDSVTVTVGEDYASWAARMMPAASAASRLPGADPDGDGQVNLLEHVMGTLPLERSAGPEMILSQGRPALRYPVSRFISPAMRVIPQVSGNLTAWSEGPSYLNDSIIQETGTAFIHVAGMLETPGTAGRRFLRLKVISP
ncbi:MAG: Ig-like domain-containing protein [Verrucomicrobiota bacterium]